MKKKFAVMVETQVEEAMKLLRERYSDIDSIQYSGGTTVEQSIRDILIADTARWAACQLRIPANAEEMEKLARDIDRAEGQAEA